MTPERQIQSFRYDTRRFSRVRLVVPLDFTFLTGEKGEGELIDVSMCGMRFRGKYGMQCGSVCAVKIGAAENAPEVRAIIISADDEIFTADIIEISDQGFVDFYKLIRRHSLRKAEFDREIQSKLSLLPERYDAARDADEFEQKPSHPPG